MSSKNGIPLVNLDRQYETLRAEIGPAIDAVLESKAFILGPYVQAFEKEFAAYTGARHAIGCSSGTSAISLALEAMGVGADDEVITVGHTFAATAGGIRHVDAIPVFVDVDPDAYLMDPAELEKAITPRTKAIVPVHLYGTPCDMDAINRVAQKHGLFTLEDAAQAHGATRNGKGAGSMGTAATFSFYPGKNLGAYGDAGAITTNDDALAERMRKLRDHGRMSKYAHDIVGYNHRMDGIQGAILSVKLKYLPAWNARRAAVAARYDGVLRQHGFKTAAVPQGATSAHHLYVVEVSNRDEIQKAMAAKDIATGVHYPIPLHQQPAFAQWSTGPLPVTEAVVSRIMSLPICGDLNDEEQGRIIEAFLAVAKP